MSCGSDEPPPVVLRSKPGQYTRKGNPRPEPTQQRAENLEWLKKENKGQ